MPLPGPQPSITPSIINDSLYYQCDARVPMTKMTLVFHGAGFQHDPETIPGLARVTSRMIFRGTPGKTREMIARELELLGASADARVSETDLLIDLSCFSRNLDRVIALVGEILTEASFPEPELEIVKQQELNSFDGALQNPERVLSSAHEYVLFGRSRYGKIGSRSAIGRITRNHVVDYYRKAVATAVAYTTSISDLPRGEIDAQQHRLTNGRSKDGFVLKPESEYQNSMGYEATIVQSEGATNDRFIWSHRGIGALDSRRFDLSLIIDALGSFEGVLFNELRNKNGWCYGAYAYVMPATTRPGRVGYYSDPAAESSMQLIPEMIRLLRTFPEMADFRERLDERRDTFKNRYAYQLDLKRKLLNEVHRDLYGIPILDQESYNRIIDAVTQESASQAIREIFDHENMTMVFYGDEKRIRSLLGQFDRKVEVTAMRKEELTE